MGYNDIRIKQYTDVKNRILKQYAVDGVADVTAVFADHSLWTDLHDKAPLGQGIVQHPPSPSNGE